MDSASTARPTSIARSAAHSICRRSTTGCSRFNHSNVPPQTLTGEVMSAVSAFKLVLLSLIAIIALELLAKRLRLPPAAALLVGGAAMAFMPGLPPVVLDPDL